MADFLKIFGEMSVSSITIFITAIVFLCTIGIKVYQTITTFHDKIQEKNDSLEELKKSMKEIKENPIITKEDWEQLKDKQDCLEKSLKEILEVQKDLAAKQEEFELESKKLNLNRLRDRLLQSYRYYTSEEKNPLQAWLEMEYEAFEKLFQNYEELGGDGFMHSTVEPAMAQLEIISMEDSEKVSILMKSRKG